MTGQLAHGDHLAWHGAERVMFGEEPMPTVPIRPKKLPSAAATFPNGQVPVGLLRGWPGDEAKPLLEIPSYGMQAFHLYAAEHGWKMRTTGRGRTYAQQESLFRSRYTPTYLAGRPYKMWNGNGPLERWYQMPGTAQAAVPGTSNHGWWCADDMALELDGDPAAESVTAAFVEWAITCAHLFGWAWELQSEPWHVHWIAGDVIPPFAVEVLQRHGVLPPEDDMALIADVRRLMDTRPLPDQIEPGAVVEVQTDHPGRAVFVNVTAVETAGPGFITVWGAGPRPGTSNVNYDRAGQIIANLATVTADERGLIRFGTGTSACDVIIDLQSYVG